MSRSDGPDAPQVPTQIPTTIGRPFANGNAGRPPGSKNRTTVLAAALLEGEAEKLLRKGVEVALGGNVPMLKFLLGRYLPRERLIKLDFPRMYSADDAVAVLGHLMRAVSKGRITPGEAAALGTLVNSYTRAIDMADMVKRMDTLEAAIQMKSRRAP